MDISVSSLPNLVQETHDKSKKVVAKLIEILQETRECACKVDSICILIFLTFSLSLSHTHTFTLSYNKYINIIKQDSNMIL